MGDPRPNILVLVNDHQAYYRHGWDGGLGPHCPHFQRLARGGIRFERAYTVTPLCVPARRTMLTGLYPHRHGLTTNDETRPTRDHGILLHLLRQAGYRTYYYGKWHAGPGTAMDYGCEGFCYPGFGNPYITPEYAEYVRELGLEPARFDVEHAFTEPFSPREVEPGPGYRCLAEEFHPHATGLLETPPETHESFFLAHLARRKLSELAQERLGQPFFMRVDFYGPHPPYFASREYVDLYDPEQIAEYGSFRDPLDGKPSVWLRETNEQISERGRILRPNPLPWREWARILAYVYGHVTQVDAAGGLILDALAELGLAENTLVIWTSDHGDPIAAHGGHFGKEAYMSEEVLRIPLALRWPGRIPAGQEMESLVSSVDVPATLADAAGVAFDEPVDGRSLLDLCVPERPHEPWRADLLCETHGHHGEQVIGRALVTRHFRYTTYWHYDTDEHNVELYDLVRDPYQLRNLVREPYYVEVVADLHRRLKDWRERTLDYVEKELSGRGRPVSPEEVRS
jgi:arylsulfatase A-like enzyme